MKEWHFYITLFLGLFGALFVARPLWGPAAELAVMAVAYLVCFLYGHYQAWVRLRADPLPTLGMATLVYGMFFLIELPGATESFLVWRFGLYGFIFCLTLCGISYLFAKDWGSRIQERLRKVGRKRLQ